MDIFRFLILSVYIGIIGFYLEDKIKKYHTLVYKILWYYLIVSVSCSVLLKKTPGDDGGYEILGLLFMLSYIAFSIYISNKSTVIFNGITKPIILLFIMNLTFWFIIVEKNNINGKLSFSYSLILIQSVIFLVCQLPIIIITRIKSKKKNASNSNVTNQ